MINKIIDGITTALSEEFSNYEIYTDTVQQGLNEPCFFVRLLSPTNKQFFDKRYKITNQFAIQYFSDDLGNNTEINDITDRLFKCLEYITVDGDLIKGTEMSASTTDEVLTFLVNYNMFVIHTENLEKMEEMKSKVGAKENE